LWEPLCFVQIGGLTAASVVTLLLVPVLYAVFVLDLKLVKWHGPEPQPPLGAGQSDPARAMVAVNLHPGRGEEPWNHSSLS